MKRSGFKNGPYKGFKPPKRRMRREAVKTRQKRLETAEEWFKLHPGPTWQCYISKHPFCPKTLTKETINLEHDISKARDKSRQFDVTNLFPACDWDNQAKGSKSAEEYMNG